MEYLNEKIGYIKRLYENTCEQTVDCDISLPDYCPDISKIISCRISPNVISTKLSGDRLCIDGEAPVRIIYSDEQNRILSYEQNYPFSKSAPIGSELSGTVQLKPRVQFSNCRAVSKRRLEVHGVIAFDFKVSKVDSREIITDIPDKTIQVKSEKFALSDMVCYDCKEFTVSEAFELPADYPSARNIISVFLCPVINETRAVKDKVLIKGEVAAELVYSPDNDKCDCVKYNCCVPVNQVVTCNGVDENCTISAFADILNYECSLRSNENSEERIMEISCCLDVLVKAFKEKEINCITDAYCTGCVLESEYEQTDFWQLKERIKETRSEKFTVDLSSFQYERICCIRPDSVKVNKTLHNGKLCLHYSVMLNIIACDSENRPVFCQREAEFDFTKSIDGKDLVPGDVTVIPTGFRQDAFSRDSIQLHGEFLINAEVFSVVGKNILTDVHLSDEKLCPCSCFVIYFPEENESVWSIARKFNSTVDLISEQNSLTQDELISREPIIIPVISG